MINKKILFYYLLEFILTISIFISLVLIILKLTILNKNYFLNKLEENNYYHELFVDINDSFSNYIMQSGFDEEIVNDIFTEDTIKKVINNNVDNFYKGIPVTIDTSDIRKNFEDNISNYLDNNNIVISDENELKLFVDEIVNIYSDRIIVHKSLNNYSNKFVKLCKLVNILIMISIVMDIILFTIIKLIFKKITLTIPIFTSILLLILIYYLLFSKININYIVFWNSYISNVIKNVFLDIGLIIKYTIVIGICLEIVKLFIFCVRKSRI